MGIRSRVFLEKILSARRTVLFRFYGRFLMGVLGETGVFLW